MRFHKAICTASWKLDKMLVRDKNPGQGQTESFPFIELVRSSSTCETKTFLTKWCKLESNFGKILFKPKSTRTSLKLRIKMDTIKEESECEPQSISSIENLPLLVMTKIFRLLATPDRESAMQVCSQWEDIIRFEVGLTMFIGNGLVYNFPGHKTVKWKPVNVISKVGIDKCVFGEMIGTKTSDYDYDDDNDKDEHTIQGFMLPELVKELSFYGRITNELFHVILTPVYWLTTLKIHLTVFRLVSFEHYALRLYSLTHLRIFYTHPVFHLSFPFKEDDPLAKDSIHRNISKFLTTCLFRCIRTFEFLGPYFVDMTKSLLDTMQVFIRRHQISLKELILSFPYEWNVQRRRSTHEIEINSGFRPLASSFPSEEQRKDIDWGNVQLRRLQVVCPATVVPPVHAASYVSQAVSSWSQQSLNGLWEALFGKQHQMTSLHYINKYVEWAFPQAIFQNNANSLKFISLSVNSKFHVDCKTLSCCKNLQRLSLEGNRFHQEENDNEDNIDEINDDGENFYQRRVFLENEWAAKENISRVFNVHHLPESLQEICLSKLMLPSSEVEVLADATPDSKRFPNLVSLQLYQICKGWPQYGLTILAVKHLFDQSNLSVSFWQALNCTSFEGVISKALNKVIDHEVMTLMKVVEHCDIEESGVSYENLRFTSLNNCHVQLIRKGKKY